MLKLSQRPACPICGSKKRTTYINFQDIPIVKCDSCGFIYSANVMSPEALESYYADGFGGERHLKGQIVNAAVNERIIRSLVKLNKSMNVLDIGTGYGFLLASLNRKWNIQGIGVELSKQEADYGNNVLGLKIHSDTLMETGLQQGSFDLVIACEVIEHTLEPIEFLKELTSFVSPNGKLIIVTDNFESDVVKSLGAGWPKWIPHTHVSHFAPTTIEKAVSKVGFKIDAVASITPWEHLSRKWIYKILGRKITASDGYDLEKALSSEMTGSYSLFSLRKLLSPLWAKYFTQKNLNGAMMYVVASRI